MKISSIIGLIVGVIGIVVGGLLLSNANSGITKMSDLNKEVKTLSRRAELSKTARESIDRSSENYKKLKGLYIADSRDFVTFIQTLESAGQELGLAVEPRIGQSSDIKGPKPGLFTRRFTLAVMGPSLNIRQYIKKIEELNKLARVNTFSLDSADLSGEATATISIDVAWSTEEEV